MERPSPTDQRFERVAASEQATRLAALNARRPRNAAAPASRRGDVQPTTERDALNARLDALASRRNLPPPAPTGTAAPSPAGRRTRRRHAARGARAAALGLSLASTGALATLFAVTGGRASAGNQVAAATIVASPRSATPTEAASPATSAAVPTSPPTHQPATTTPVVTVATPAIVDGAVFNNKWGDVQVEATFAPDGTLLAVTTLQTPYRDGKSVRINDRAVPQLNSEALTAQSANVDTVSGATYTSNDYRRSLQSAIDTARTAGLTAIA
jgi:uncharacterized protein with FMN-binding domain